MIDAIRTFWLNEKSTIIEASQTVQTQAIESLQTTKVPVIVAGSTMATSFTSQEAAQWAAACLSMMLAGKVLVDIWARVTEVVLKKKESNKRMKELSDDQST